MLEYFFFQAEDGIRDYKVTGVQTCALPIVLPGTRRRPGPVVRTDPRRSTAAALPRPENPRVPLRPGRVAEPPAVRGAARRGPHRSRRGPLRGHPRARRRAEAHGSAGAERQVR